MITTNIGYMSKFMSFSTFSPFCAQSFYVRSFSTLCHSTFSHSTFSHLTFGHSTFGHSMLNLSTFGHLVLVIRCSVFWRSVGESFSSIRVNSRNNCLIFSPPQDTIQRLLPDNFNDFSLILSVFFRGYYSATWKARAGGAGKAGH